MSKLHKFPGAKNSLDINSLSHRTLTILGSTGSIGQNTVDLIERYPKKYDVEVLTAQSNIDLLARQAKRLKARCAVIGDPSKYESLKSLLSGSGIEVSAGSDAIIEAAEKPTNFLMVGIVGAAGLKPTMAAIRRGATIGLANKECLVCAGELMMSEVIKSKATLLPVDSEHNAIFQVFDFEDPGSVKKIILTASGGPFRGKGYEAMRDATPDEAIAHPNWDMGAKISVDSATMMNKGLEMIEAFHLFPIEAKQIEVLVHPQSVIHSMVSYVDGSFLAQLGTPDMRIPIAYSLAWPERLKTPSPPLDLASLGSLDFEHPDEKLFPALRLARQAMEGGGALPITLNAANEVAVEAFLKGRIRLTDISELVFLSMEQVNFSSLESLEDVLNIDSEARLRSEEILKNKFNQL